MFFDQNKFKEAISQSDSAAVQEQCEYLIKDFYQDPASFTDDRTEPVMEDLRGMRQFALMVRLGDVFLQMGQASNTVRKLFAQALIEEKIYMPTISVLKDLIRNINDDTAKESCEAHGLMGRIYKQLYVNAGNPLYPAARRSINQAMETYYTVYNQDKSKRLWFGINCVALAVRARIDGIDLDTTVSVLQEATFILETIEAKKEPRMGIYDSAIAMEACIALGNFPKALYFAGLYTEQEEASAFNYAGTLRQLTEIWRLNSETADNKMKQLIPLIRGALLQRDGGALSVKSNELKNELANRSDLTQEALLGTDKFQSYDWYMRGAARCLAVGRIGKESTRGLGTGFLMPGEKIHPELAGEMVLLTNAHVVTEKRDDERNALLPYEVKVVFEALDLPKSYYEVKDKPFFNSPSNDLDVTILQFEKVDSDELKAALLQKKLRFDVARHLPDKKKGRVYIIGHPAGGTLQLSLLDNVLLDFDDDRLMHYRAPTVGGSSGSPVYDDDWQLIGIHHAGGEAVRRLNNEEGMYAANEGIQMKAILAAITKQKEKK